MGYMRVNKDWKDIICGWMLQELLICKWYTLRSISLPSQKEISQRLKRMEGGRVWGWGCWTQPLDRCSLRGSNWVFELSCKKWSSRFHWDAIKMTQPKINITMLFTVEHKPLLSWEQDVLVCQLANRTYHPVLCTADKQRHQTDGCKQANSLAMLALITLFGGRS